MKLLRPGRKRQCYNRGCLWHAVDLSMEISRLCSRCGSTKSVAAVFYDRQAQALLIQPLLFRRTGKTNAMILAFNHGLTPTNKETQ